MDIALIANPPIVAFGLSVAAGLSKLRVNVPAAAFAVASGYLLIAIGLKGGVSLAGSMTASAWTAVAVAVAISAITPIIILPILEKWIGLDRKNAAAVAAHYGSISIVTFTVATAFLERAGFEVPPYAVAMAASMELPAILVAFAMAGSAKGVKGLISTTAEVITGRASVLLLMGLGIGMLFSESEAIGTLTSPFNIVLTGFLALMGIKVAGRIGDLRVVGSRLVAFAILAPLIFGSGTAALGVIAGLDVATATVLATLAASASYIAAPAAVSKGIPDASPAVYMAPPLVVTFPFNVLVGILIYHRIAVAMAG